MPEYITLMGSEEIAKAGYAIRDAAQDMQRAVSALDGALEQQRRFMTDWLQLLEQVLKDNKP